MSKTPNQIEEPGAKELEAKAEALWPSNQKMQMRQRWLQSISYLRNHSKKGWLIDNKDIIRKVPEARTLS